MENSINDGHYEKIRKASVVSFYSPTTTSAVAHRLDLSEALLFILSRFQAYSLTATSLSQPYPVFSLAMAPTFLQVTSGLLAVFAAMSVVHAETHTIKFDNQYVLPSRMCRLEY